MDTLLEIIEVLRIPFFTCLVIASLHCYMGLHVLRRGVIFVDLALAQCAALGAAVALFLAPVIWPDEHDHTAPKVTTNVSSTSEASLADQLALEGLDDEISLTESPAPDEAAAPHAGCAHDEEHGRFSYFMSLVFALLGALLLSVGRFKDERIPHEAIIGIIFVVCAALCVLILSKAPHGHEAMEAMLTGMILFASESQLINMLLLYIVLGALHMVFRKKFIAISENVAAADKAGVRVKVWDCLFFATFALMVTQSVSIAGVFVVFSYLIIPAACGVLLGKTFGKQLLVAWGVAVITTMGGLAFSAVADMPTGSSLVSCFGAALLVCALVSRFVRRAPDAAPV